METVRSSSTRSRHRGLAAEQQDGV